ncbi:hypothetical protein ACJX0J_038999, partial [Zea mays]
IQVIYNNMSVAIKSKAICELGSTIGAVEEVDINSLNSKEIVSGDEDSGKDIKGKSPLKISSSQANDEEFNDSEDDLLHCEILHAYLVQSIEHNIICVLQDPKIAIVIEHTTLLLNRLHYDKQHTQDYYVLY